MPARKEFAASPGDDFRVSADVALLGGRVPLYNRC